MVLFSGYKDASILLLFFSHQVESHSLLTPRLKRDRLRCPWNSPSKNTRVGCHSLLQGIFPTQESNPDRELVCCC